nr:oligosaccharide flippase family protein [uncultured Draconibacterium sp.]
MLEKVKKALYNHKVLVQNFSYLSALQVFNLLIPLITYPYLIRVLGKDNYGLIVFAQTVINYLLVIVNFGFNISATKEVSIHRNNSKKLSEIVSSVYLIKSILFILCLITLSIVLYIIPEVKGPKILYFLVMWICLYDLIFPIWYFQGIEKMQYITILTLTSRVTFLIFIFILVKSQSQFLRVPIINGIGAIIAGTISLYIVFIKHKVKFILVPISTLSKYFKESFVLFSTNVIMTFKDKTNILLIGTFIGTGAVAEFDLAVKIKDLLFIPINLLNQALYPKISKERNMKFMLKVLKLAFLGIVAITIILFPFVDKIVLLLGGNELINSAHLTRIILISVPIIVISFTLATNCINALGYYKLRFKSMLITTCLYFVLIGVGILSGWETKIAFYAYVIVIGYAAEFLYRLHLIHKYQMLK